ncbi:hypothetical protein KVT40_002951 [Elsinoe batatas]|uniref:Metallo-dependent hydrolase n=1 Tax=Elsinoe batatas TaxID=2601811 RepID=A0A8K0PGL0_9PEZI|nr:hypothetical protein KVT40_002951 [Elsinoe batatas]
MVARATRQICDSHPCLPFMTPQDNADGSGGNGQIGQILQCRLGASEKDHPVDIKFEAGCIADIALHSTGTSQEHPTSKHAQTRTFDAGNRLLAPSLCHPHVHLDKAFILGHPKYSHLQVKDGTFDEAMKLTNEAKKMFELDDLLVRGRRSITESILAGVSHMRAFVEVDEIVGLKCLEAGTTLKQEFEDRCHVQLCAFAQLPLKPNDPAGDKIRHLMVQALLPEHHVDAVGSTPYVEKDEKAQQANIEWLVDLALEYEKHLDFHLDYSVDPESPAMVHLLLQFLKHRDWTSKSNKCITLGHCTRLIFYSDKDLHQLRTEIGDLPVSFVGLPTSDLYMMKTDPSLRLHQSELRTTLNVPKLIKDFGFNAAIGMNNIGNAFTPYGTCDPLFLATIAAGIYQTGTQQDARLLYDCVSSRAKAAIGFEDKVESGSERTSLRKGDEATFVLFPAGPEGFVSEQSIEGQIYYYNQGGRQVFYRGRLIT